MIKKAFGFKRLSIIDPNPDLDQPMFDEKENLILFNGKIYNFLEIKEELLNLGVKFRTKSDNSEVILEGYKKFGIVDLHKRY